MNFSEDMWYKLRGKKVVVYGADTTAIRFLYEAQKKGLNVAYIVDRDKSKQGSTLLGKRIEDPSELLYENSSILKIVVAAPAGKQSIVNTLLDMGFTTEEHIVLDYVESNSDYSADILLGISRGENTLVAVREQLSSDEKTLLVLGGSTTDPNYNGIHPWTYYLQKKFDNAGIPIKIINGGVIGYTTSQELLLLLREGVNVCPDIVISYSGYNDVAPAINIDQEGRFNLVSRNTYITVEGLINHYKKSGNEFGAMYYGKKMKNTFEIYYQNMRSMKAICEEFNANFMGVLQPCICSLENVEKSFWNLLLKEKMCIDLKKEWDKFYNSFIENFNNVDYMYDFTKIIQTEDDAYFDLVHMNERGNEIIAENMFRILL